MQPVRVGFLGFGEAAYRFARGLARNGLSGIVAYSRSGAKAASGDPLRQRAAEAGVEPGAAPRRVCEIVTRFVCGTAVHPQRRVHEMSEALALLQSLRSSSRMTRAPRSKRMEVSERGLRERFGGRKPDSIPVIEAIVPAGA